MTDSDLATILTREVPKQSAIQRPADYPLLHTKRSNEPLVDLSLYGVAGQSYYSRPNSVFLAPVAGVATTVWVRRSIAEKLSDINFALQSKEVEAFFGRKVELFVDDGWRSPELEVRLHPGLKAVSPHASGAAIHIKLRYTRDEQGFVANSALSMGPRSEEAAALDFFERNEPQDAREKTAQRNRRALYWIMRGALLSDDSGFVCSPTQWWHWSYGDQQWAAQRELPYAFFGQVSKP